MSIITLITLALKIVSGLMAWLETKEIKNAERTRMAAEVLKLRLAASDFLADARRRGISLPDSPEGPRLVCTCTDPTCEHCTLPGDTAGT